MVPQLADEPLNQLHQAGVRIPRGERPVVQLLHGEEVGRDADKVQGVPHGDHDRIYGGGVLDIQTDPVSGQRVEGRDWLTTIISPDPLEQGQEVQGVLAAPSTRWVGGGLLCQMEES